MTQRSVSVPVLSPHDIPDEPIDVLVDRWWEIRTRLLRAACSGGAADPADVFADLAYGARTAQETLAGRWCAVARLLRANAARSWFDLGIAMGTTATKARDGFYAWITGQGDLRRRTGAIGLTDADATELRALAEELPW